MYRAYQVSVKTAFLTLSNLMNWYFSLVNFRWIKMRNNGWPHLFALLSVQCSESSLRTTVIYDCHSFFLPCSHWVHLRSLTRASHVEWSWQDRWSEIILITLTRAHYVTECSKGFPTSLKVNITMTRHNRLSFSVTSSSWPTGYSSVKKLM